jgi:hypothetical protein
MKIEQLVYSVDHFTSEAVMGSEAQWVLVFGSGKLICDREIIDNIREMYPNAYLMGCSTAGEIYQDSVNDNSITVTAVAFEKANVRFKSFELGSKDSSDIYYEIGQKIISELDKDNLKHIFILCEGLNINGSKLVDGMRTSVQNFIPITGGLAGDGSEFKETYIIDNGYAKQNCIVLAAIYGDIYSGYASVGGWDTFGIERIVTKSNDNILYEMDGKPALNLYKEYLGEKAKELPSSALLFPLSVRYKNSDESFVRTILAVDEDMKSLIFAGDITEGSYCKLMKSNANNLVKGSMEAAELGKEMLGHKKVELAILVSCVGRKLVLKHRVDEEIEAITEVIGLGASVTGFYSYGEIAPYRKGTNCELHNQTMTVTFFSEE